MTHFGIAIGLAALVMSVACIPEELDGDLYQDVLVACGLPGGARFERPDEAGFKRVVADRSSTTPLEFVGAEWDDTLLVDCSVRLAFDPAIRLVDVRHFWVVGCTVDQTYAGLIVERSKDVVVLGSTFSNLRNKAISFRVHERTGAVSENVRVQANVIHKAGGGAIDVAAERALIDSNAACDDRATFAVKLAGSGTVSGNLVREAQGGALLVSASAADSILIENNMIDAVKDGLVVRGSGAVDVRFNTILSAVEEARALRVEGPATSARGNLLVHRTLDRGVEGTLAVDQKNYFQRGVAGFEVENRPLDLHLTADHAALGFATGLSFPPLDIDGQAREGERVDAGADQRAP